MLSTRQRAEEFGVGGTDVCLPTTIKWQHRGAPLHSDGRAEEFKKLNMNTRQRVEEFGAGGADVCLPTTIKWQHRDKMAASRCAITFRWKSGRVQEELNMIHYPRAAACFFTRLRAEESNDFIEAHCGVSSRERPDEIVIY